MGTWIKTSSDNRISETGLAESLATNKLIAITMKLIRLAEKTNTAIRDTALMTRVSVIKTQEKKNSASKDGRTGNQEARGKAKKRIWASHTTTRSPRASQWARRFGWSRSEKKKSRLSVYI